LRTKIGNENLKKYYSLAEMAVKAAELTYTERGQGRLKKSDVESYLINKTGGKLSQDEIRRLTEAAVWEMQKIGKSITLGTTNPVPTTPFVFHNAVNGYDYCPAAQDIPTPTKEG
jgi:hypothetical protein